MEGDVARIEKLQNATTWLQWKFQVKIILSSMDIFDVVSGLEEIPDASESDADAKIIKWKKKDAKAQRVIVTSISSQPMTHILNCKTACEMWTKLHGIFEQKSDTSIHYLQQRFYKFEKDPQDNMAMHFSKLEEIVQQLHDLGEEISDSMFITKILMTLPKEFNHFHSAWESTAEENRTAEKLRVRLMIEENRISSNDLKETNEAFYARKEETKKEKKDISNIKCFFCKRKGHYVSKCPDINKSNEKQGEAFVCEQEKVNDVDSWYLDSGATDHMCNQSDWFANIRKLESPKIVRVGNGETISAEAIGDINIMAFDGDRWINKHLMNVLYLPKIRINLFSSNRALDKGYQLRSNQSRCELTKEGNVVAVGVRQTGLFRMMFRVILPEKGSSAFVATVRESLSVWHERLAHQNKAHVRNFLKRNCVDFVDEDFLCEACIYGKHHRGSFKQRIEKTTKCGEIIHTDVCGPMQNVSVGGSRYFVLFKDDFSHFRFIYFMKKKSEVVEKLKIFIAMTQKETGHNIQVLRSDNGTEFVNNEVKSFLEGHGIRHQRTVPYTPEQNGSAEREMRTVVELARTMLHSTELNYDLWAEAVNTATFVLNRTGTSTVKDKTPYELWYGKQAMFNSFKKFGCDVYIHIPKEKRMKFDRKALKCVFVGYDENVKGFRVLNTEKNTVEIARDVIFNEMNDQNVVFNFDSVSVLKQNNNNISSNSQPGQISDEQDVPKTPSEATENEVVSVDVTSVENANETDVTENTWSLSRLRPRKNVNYNELSEDTDEFAMMAVCEEPTTYHEAMNSHDRNNWIEAMNDEYSSLIKNKTWMLVNQPINQKVIDNRWVFKIKENPNGTIERYKARLVVRGFTQQYGVNYEETFSPVAKFTSIRAILSLVAIEKLKIKQFDVKTAFLNGDLEEDIYMKQPIGFDDNSGKVCKLLKSLYGLKQASRCWNHTFTNFIKGFGFKSSDADPCVFVRSIDNKKVILAIYVDDGLVAAESDSEIDIILHEMQKSFEIKVFESKCFLGIEIEKNNDCIFIHQAAYAKKVLNKFRMFDCNPVSIPADTSKILCSNQTEEVGYPYREAVGSLMYLAIGTRPDISFAVGNASRFLEKPESTHVNAVKRIFKYIKGTINYGILYDGKFGINFHGYSDADHGGDIETRRSTTGYAFVLGSGIISWCSERQKCVSISTTEAEYVAASQAVKELVWLKRLLQEIVSTKQEIPFFYMDNESAMRLAKNPEYHKRTKHIDIRFHFIREKVIEKCFLLKHVSTKDQLADVFTKALPRERFQEIRKKLNIIQK